jgi:hypothetical protein
VENVMALHGGLDTAAIVTGGMYSETYTSANPSNLPSLFVSYGYVEDAIAPGVPTASVKWITVKMPSQKNLIQVDSRKKRKISM